MHFELPHDVVPMDIDGACCSVKRFANLLRRLAASEETYLLEEALHGRLAV